MRGYVLLVGLGLVALAQKSNVTSAALAMQDGDFERALSYVDKALAQPDLLKAQDLAKAYKIRAQAYVSLLVKDPAKTPEKYPDVLGEIVRSIQKCRELDAKKEFSDEIKITSAQAASILYLKGFELFQKEKLAQARQHLTWAIELYESVGQKDFYPPVALRGLVSLQMGDTTAAIQDLERARTAANAKPIQGAEQLMPFVYTGLIKAYGAQRKVEQALQIVQEARSKFPTDENIRRTELNLYLQNPDLQERAIEQFRQEVQKNPRNEEHLLIYAQLLERNYPDSAAAYYEKVLSINPNNVNANYNLGAYYVNQAAEISQRYNEEKDEATQKRLYAQMQDKFRQALPYLERAHEALPTDLALLQSLIQVTTYLGMEDKAKSYLQKKNQLQNK